MKNEILDEIEKHPKENQKPITRIIQIAIGSVILLFLIEKSREVFPEYVFGIEPIKTAGLLIMIVIISTSILIPNSLNVISPKLKILQIVIYTGLIFIGIEIVFKMTQNLFIFKNKLSEIEYIYVFRPAMVIATIGMLIANIRIHKLRNKKTLIPTLLMFGIWAIIGLILKK